MADAASNAADLKALSDEYFRSAYRRDPVFATEVGIHQYDARLQDFSKEAIADDLKTEKEFLARLQGFDQREWSVDDQIDAALLASHMKSSIRWVERLRSYETHPQTYVYAPLWGVYVLLIREFAPLETRLESAVGRLRATPRVLEEGRANLTRPAKVFTEIAIDAARDSLSMYRQMVPAAAEAVPALKKDVESAAEEAASAMEGFIEYLEKDLLPRSDGEFAVGREIFDEMLRENHFLNYTSETMLAKGRELYDGIRSKMVVLAKEIDPDADLRAVMDRVNAVHPEPEELVDAYRTDMIRARDFAFERGLFRIPVEEDLELRETPPGLRGTIPYAMYLPPAPLEDQQVGTFFVTPVDMEADAAAREKQLQGHSSYQIPVVSLHEGYPGHHLQLVWANTHPSLIRKQLWSTLFVEGWAFYCEELMEREGFLGDPRSRLARLDAELWRAARIIADVSLHTRGMTVEEGVALLVEAGRDEPGAKAEVRRYTMSPTQPMSYLIGKLEIFTLADQYRAEKGEDFDLAEFHEALLSCGSVPPALAGWQLFGRMKS